jgi:plastocyanin
MKSVASSLAFLVAVVVCALPASAQGPHIVNAACCGFQDPANGNSNQTIVIPGTQVQWVRTDGLNHTVTNGNSPTDPAAGTLFNGTLTGVATTFSHTFNTLGSFNYFCNPHFPFGMIGTVHVVPPASSTSTGTGCSTSAGTATLATTGLPVIGNSAFGFTVSGGPSGAQAFLFLAASTGPPIQVSGTCFVYLDFVSLNAFMMAGITPSGPQILNLSGMTTFAFPVPNVGGLGGVSGAAQALIIDALAPGGFAISNAVSVVVGGV